MLRTLSIQNYAIIDQLEIGFSKNLNIITGETGAGKSIIVGALGLILGDRADSSVLVNKEKKSIVEGVFTANTGNTIQNFLKAQELDADDDIITIRREIAVNGKSRAFINDTPVTLQQLQQLSSLMVDLHQQFDTLEVGESDFQRQVIDALANQLKTVAAYQEVFRQWKEAKRITDELRGKKQQFDKEADYNQFQYNELEEAGFKENELENIDAELKLQSNSEGIKGVMDRVTTELQDGENPVVQQLKVLLNQLQQYTSLHPDLPALVQRLQSTQIELQDIADEVERIGNHIQYDPERVMQLNERLSMGYKLQKKHGVNNTAALLAIQEQLAAKLKQVLDMDDQIQEKEKETARLQDEALKQAKKISDNRKKQLKPFEENVNRLLGQVGMPNARIKVQFDQQNILNADGIDTIEFLFDANKSGQFQPVHKVASGGELSRLMLCIKSLVAKSIDLPTMIFDEIDTGISGEAARQVGIILKELATTRQVISITHQPQIAGKADAHFFVYKETVKNAVKTNIRQLSIEERVVKIAQMLSGEKPTAAALENARELVNS